MTEKRVEINISASGHVVTFAPGESETDDVVRDWLDRQGIDKSLVSGYSIFRHQGEIPIIMLEMHFDDSPVEGE